MTGLTMLQRKKMRLIASKNCCRKTVLHQEKSGPSEKQPRLSIAGSMPPPHNFFCPNSWPVPIYIHLGSKRQCRVKFLVRTGGLNLPLTVPFNPGFRPSFVDTFWNSPYFSHFPPSWESRFLPPSLPPPRSPPPPPPPPHHLASCSPAGWCRFPGLIGGQPEISTF